MISLTVTGARTASVTLNRLRREITRSGLREVDYPQEESTALTAFDINA
jgi:hypothetical protein